MPCFDGRENRDREHASEAVRLLCELCRVMERTRMPLSELSVADLPAWWERHKAIDREDGRATS
jgi:hypothetical protein